jgi:hypothetical protein
MKAKSINGKVKYLSYLMIFFQGILLALLTVFLLGTNYNSAWANYGESSSSLTVYIGNLSNEKEQTVESLLLGENTDFHNVFVSRIDEIQTNNSTAICLSVAGNARGASNLEFLGKTVVSSEDLKELLQSSKENATLGVSSGTINSIKQLPHVFGAYNAYAQKLEVTLGSQGNLAGTYVIQGLGSNTERYLDTLSQLSGESISALTTPNNGHSSDSSVFIDLTVAFLILGIFTLLLTFIVLAVNGVEIFGKLILLGWKKIMVFEIIFLPFIYATIIFIPVISVLTWLWSGLSGFSYHALVILILVGMLNFLITALTALVAGLILLLTKSVDAIRERLPQKRLYALGILGYIIISIFLILFCIFIDGPLRQVQTNTRVFQAWQSVRNYQILSGINYGGDGEFTNGQVSEKFNQDFYNWYSSISNEKGVYLVQTNYIDRAAINQSGAYSSTPDQSFWDLEYSPNYLSEIGFPIKQDEIEAAKAGVRVYFIPSTMTTASRTKLIAFLKESDEYELTSGSLDTPFSKNRQFEFVDYRPNKNIFTWSIMLNQNIFSKTPVIMMATPQNLTWSEAESLGAGDFNGYVKFSNQGITNKYASADYLAKYNLQNTNMKFTTVNNYVDGLQKQLMQTVQLFGGAIMIMILMIVFVLIALATIFRKSNKEKLMIGKFLGYSFRDRYLTPLVLLASVSLVELAVVLIAGSNIGIAFVIFAALVQYIVFWLYMSRDESKMILEELKGK